ncbi:MAG: helix-turn-helix domain-containing protein [Lachnospiraceae bacterium]|nr:helix-turn-helix domain-containing protein [Lachnospiraceae bacterium]
MARITTHEAAERLGIPEQTIRILMQRGLLPIGICTKLSEGSERYTYIIISEQLEKWQQNGSLIGNTEERTGEDAGKDICSSSNHMPLGSDGCY